MDQSLWDSARELLDEAGVNAPDRPETPGAAPTDLLDYAAYFDLDFALRVGGSAEDDIRARAAVHLEQRLGQGVPLEPAAATPRISQFGTTDYSPEQLQQMSRWWDTEPANRMAMTAASDEEFARTSAAIETAIAYLREGAPELHSEIEIVVRDIVLAKPDGSQLINYSGASSFALWGAITINAETQFDWTQCYCQIVHETGHNLLFAIARNEPLVKGDAAVRRRSPLRADERPLDGIFHAAYVSAREALALETLLQWHEDGGNLPQDDVDLLTDTLRISVVAFWDCVKTLRADDNGPTDLGAAVLAECEAYMSETFALQPC